jgi:4-hydroxy-4-methyl-2-oxoglutarate aldolase
VLASARGAQAASHVGSALLASVAGARAAIIHGFEPAWFGASVSGRAFTVLGAAGDNLALHQAVLEADRGDVIVVEVAGERRCAHLGDILVRMAQQRGIAGWVVNGAIRDRSSIADLGFPVFHLGTSPRKPDKVVPGQFRVPVELDGVRIETGDLVSADDDGIVVVAAAQAEQLLARAAELAQHEEEICARIADGETTLSILGLPVPS